MDNSIPGAQVPNSPITPPAPAGRPKTALIATIVAAVLVAVGVLAYIAMSRTGVSDEEKRAGVSTVAPEDRTPLRWMGHWLTEDKRETLVREIAKEFQTINPDIDLTLKFHMELFGGWSKEKTADFIVQQIRTGVIDWDIVWMDTDIYGMVAQRLGDVEWGKKYLVDFMGVPGFKATQRPFITEDPSYRDQTGGVLVGPYLEGYYIFAWYNKSVADKLGITVKREGMTFEDFRGYVCAVDAYNKKNGTSIAAIYEAKDWISTSNFLLQSLFKSEIGKYNIVKAEIGSPEKNAALLKSFKALEDLGKCRPLAADFRNNVWFDTRNLILEDKALFHLNGVWMYNHWNSIDVQNGTSYLTKMVPAELPTFKPVDYYIGGYIPTWGVMKQSPNADAAVRLLMYLSKPQVAEKWTRYTKAPTAIKGSLSTGTTGTDIYEQFQSVLNSRYGANLHDTPNAGYILGEANRLLQKDIDALVIALLEGKTTAARAYSELMVKVR